MRTIVSSKYFDAIKSYEKGDYSDVNNANEINSGVLDYLKGKGELDNILPKIISAETQRDSNTTSESEYTNDLDAATVTDFRIIGDSSDNKFQVFVNISDGDYFYMIDLDNDVSTGFVGLNDGYGYDVFFGYFPSYSLTGFMSYNVSASYGPYDGWFSSYTSGDVISPSVSGLSGL